MVDANTLTLCKYISIALASISFVIDVSKEASLAGTLFLIYPSKPPPFQFLSVLIAGI